jgi:ubiquinone/menaquinone biosynthesis C-methylase UbiE
MKRFRGDPDKSRRYHDRVARQYDAIYDDPYWEYHDELTWSSIKPHLPRDLALPCADLGCGTGKWAMRLLKSGFAVTLVDHSGAMVEQARGKVAAMGNKAARATLLQADMIDLSALSDGQFALVLAMGDPLSICVDPAAAVREMNRICRPGGVVIASADNQLAAIDYYAKSGDLDGLETLVTTGRVRWLTADAREQFDLTTFTPASLHRLFEKAGFEVLDTIGKTILPVRKYPQLLARPDAVQRMLKLEAQLGRDPAAAAVAGHLQITARKPPTADKPHIRDAASP